jgi:hypothetical protein
MRQRPAEDSTEERKQLSAGSRVPKKKKKSSVSCDRHAMFTGTLLPLLWREQEVTTFAASAAGRTHLGLFVCLFAGPSSGMDRPDEP